MSEMSMVCDDDPRRAKRWAALVEQHIGDTQLRTGAELASLIESVTKRAETARQGGSLEPAGGERADLSDLDGTRYLFLDFDFTPDPTGRLVDEGHRAVADGLRGRTGERLAYFARAHSSAGYIVVINQHFKSPTFDLTMQRFSASFADVNVSGSDMDNSALWTGVTAGEGKTRYNPWSWPVLPKAAETTDACREIVDDLDASVLDALALPRRAFHSRQLDIFSGDPETANFRSLTGSSLGLDPKDEPTPEGERTIAASVLSRWLTQVVAAQNVVSDLPHVLTRFPSLAPDLCDEPDLKNLPGEHLPPLLAENRHQPVSRLAGRDVWDLETVRRLAGDVKRLDKPPLAFCEDSSRFVDLESAIEVETDLPGPYGRRFVEQIDGIDYLPLNRLLA